MPSLQFFTEAQMDTLEKVIEVLIVTDGHDAISAKEAALSINTMLATSNSPALDTIPQVFDQLENVIPPLFLEFKKFSQLDKSKRKTLLTKVINNEGLIMDQFRDLARALKVMSCVSYYGSEAGMRQVGYEKVEERNRFAHLDQTEIVHLENTDHA